MWQRHGLTKRCGQQAVHDAIGVSANGRGEVRVYGACQAEVQELLS